MSILLFGRLVPGIRTPLFLTAGIMRLPMRYFFVADGLGAVLGNSVLFFLAWWFGDSFKELVDRNVNTLKPTLIMIVVGGVGVYYLFRFLRRPLSTGDPRELPLIGQQVASRIDHEHLDGAEFSHQPAAYEGLRDLPPFSKDRPSEAPASRPERGETEATSS
jgi:hypothetical protein